MKFLKRFLIKRLLPFIASNIRIKTDTVTRKTGVWQKFSIKLFGWNLIEKEFKIADEQNNLVESSAEMLSIEEAKKLPESAKKKIREGYPDVFNDTVELPNIENLKR